MFRPKVCERVIVINNGQIGYDGTVDQLRERIGLPTVIKITYRCVSSGWGELEDVHMEEPEFEEVIYRVYG
jgi:ABC-2 type transport system ATP-binding protein